MTSIAEDVATNLVQRLIDGAIREVNYLCCFKTHVGTFEKKRKLLDAKKSRVLKDIEDAIKRNETQVEDDVQLWLNETDGVNYEDTKTNMKCFHGWCPNCILQYRQGRKLAKKTEDITSLIESCNFDRVARLAKPPGIKYYSPQIFIDFESRKSNSEELVKAIENENHYMIGLQGLGGTGKTTLATQVGEQIEESKAFQKVIFVVVSNPLDINKIRQKIANQLELQLEQGKEDEHPVFLWARIADYKGKVLIILDDIWEWLDLRDVGIPCGPNYKNCYVLITTRDLKVCEAMGCQQTIILQTLSEDDALNLFIQQVGKRNDDSSQEFKDLTLGIVMECGGIPLAIVAVATTIKGWPLQVWKSSLNALQNFEPLRNVHRKLEEKVYKILKLSYDNLEVKAKDLLLLCSLFPEDYEIPIDLLSKLAIALDLFREVDNYFEARRKVILVKNDLIKCSLLLEVKKNCVKMHDLVREVALWIADQKVQVIMDSRRTLKSNLQFLFWSNDDFPNVFDATKLEILIIYINGEAKMREPTIFEGMPNLKALFLECSSYSNRESFAPSLQLLPSLKSIRTLIFCGCGLGNISILKNIKCLETFELEYCSITELPKEFSELKKLKLLGLRKCNVERNNPFEVIERCSQLEEVYFVQNGMVKDWKPAENTSEVAQDICPLMLQRFSIACSGFKYFADEDDGRLNCFNTKCARELISESMFEDLIGRAEVLEFWETGEAGWDGLVGGRMMNDLIKLYLCDLVDIRCLIDRDMPDGSFRQLQILKLQNCEKLQHLCFDANLKLPHLKRLDLEDCLMLQPSIFQLQPSVALCVEQLEQLIIKDCNELRSLITYESLDGEEIVSYGSPFQKLKSLQIERCDKLELVSPLFSAGDLSCLEDLCILDCKEMKYIFGEYRNEGQSLHQDIILPSVTKTELIQVRSFIDIFRECKICTQRSSPILKDDSKEKHAMSFPGAHGYGCCFLPTTKDIDIGVSNSSLQNLEATKESCASSKRIIETFNHTTERLMRQPLSLQNIREVILKRCPKLKSLFSVSIATTMIMLEELYIDRCEELKHIITNEKEDDDHLSCTSIFPNLQQLEVTYCNELEFIFPSTLSGGLQKLQSIVIQRAAGLKYVFGAYNNHQNIDVVPINLPALKTLSFVRVPEIISLCANKYYAVCPSLQHIALNLCWGLMKRGDPDFIASHQGRQLELETGKGLITKNSLFPDFMICLKPRQPTMETSKDYMKIIMNMQNLVSLEVRYSETIEEIFNVEGIQSERPVTLSLQEMRLEYLGELRHIYKGPNNILSLHNLKVLRIEGCNKLRALFTTSSVKSLPRLSYLEVMECEELAHIIEEDEYETSSYGRSHQLRFPMLETIDIRRCDGLRSLFWISTKPTMLPNLKTLIIEEACRLEEVFRCQQDDTQEMLIQNVFPNVSQLQLIGLPELRTICLGIDFHSVPGFSVYECPKYRENTFELIARPQNITSENRSPIEELQSTDYDTDQAMSDMGEAKLEQEIEAQELATSSSANLAEESEDVHIAREPTLQVQRGRLRETKTTTNAPHKSDTPFDDDDLMKTESRRETVMTHQQELGEMTSVMESFPKDSTSMKTTIATASIYPQARGSQSGTSELLINEQPRTEQNLADQLNSREVTSGIKVPHQTNIAIMKEAMEQSFQEHHGLKEDLTPSNSKKGLHHSLEPGKEVVGIATASTSTTASSNSKSLETGEEAFGTFLTSGLSMATTSSNLEGVENIHEDTTTMKSKANISFSYSQAKIEKVNTSSFNSHVEGSQSCPSMMIYKETKEEIGKVALALQGTSTSLDLEITRRARRVDVQDGPKSEMAEMANLLVYPCDIKPKMLMEDNTRLPDVIPYSHHQSQTGATGSSSQILEIGEIFQLVELKDGESVLLAKALELYPQLRLSRGQCPHPIIAFSYRVLVDILVMLATKTPYTITASDRTTLEANLSAAKFLGFDKDWIELVRVKVFGVDNSDVLVVEEKISGMEEELEKIDIALESMQKKRIEAKERLAMAQNEFEVVDTQLFNLLEHRRNLDMKMAEFRKIIKAKDRPFGI